MCGVIGFISKNNISVRSHLNANYKSILDRGLYFSRIDKVYESYGYVRLPTDAISDPTLHRIQKAQNGYFLFNGHISNVLDLCKMFQLGSSYEDSDTKCLAKGFIAYGKEFLSKCRGMFAFAYCTEDKIILVRDTIGIKPMYYINAEDVFSFCSEIKGLHTTKTEEIHEVLPGEIVIFNKITQTVTKEKFNYESYKKYKKKDLLLCMYDSVVTPTKRYLSQSKNYKIGVLVSGGVDSSLLIGMLSKYLTKKEKKRVVGFCIGTQTATDRKIAQKLVRDLDITIVQVKPYTKNKSLTKIPEIVYKVESKFPRVVKVALLQDALAERIQRYGIHVVISGEGADEIFYGYERFINGLAKKHIDTVYSYFFNRVFYNTLLQRLERIFAKRQIEGRVPFLDQELI